MTDSGPPQAHPSITRETVHALVADQFPHLADHPLGERFDGWDMAMFRLGEALAVRLPRVERAVASLAREVHCTSTLAHGWQFAYPHIVGRGVPARGYPWSWAVVTWVPGTTADATPLLAPAGTALGEAVAQFHAPASADAWFNPEQSLTLAERSGEVGWALGEVEVSGGPDGARLDVDAARVLWETALASAEPGTRVWSHADLHGSNILGEAGAFAGIIDWGKIAACDPAVDLAFLYTAMPAEGVELAFDAYRSATSTRDAGLEARARGIALHKCLLWARLDRPLNVTMAWRGLASLGVARAA